jgi:hypothetical protein
MEATRLDMAASVARLLAGAISFLYLLLALPQLDGFEPAKLASPWYAAGLFLTLAWLPLLWLHVRTAGRRLNGIELAASFGPLVLFAGFFSLLFALA